MAKAIKKRRDGYKQVKLVRGGSADCPHCFSRNLILYPETTRTGKERVKRAKNPITCYQCQREFWVIFPSPPACTIVDTFPLGDKICRLLSFHRPDEELVSGNMIRLRGREGRRASMSQDAYQEFLAAAAMVPAKNQELIFLFPGPYIMQFVACRDGHVFEGQKGLDIHYDRRHVLVNLSPAPLPA